MLTEGGTVICSFNELPEENENYIDKIVENTANTWQQGRDDNEKRQNTLQGKLAERAVMYYLSQAAKDLIYIPYDSFRADNYEKHAPFDGLIFKKSAVSAAGLKTFIDKINAEVQLYAGGKITESLRRELLENRIYSVEIKSTKVTGRHRPYKFNGYRCDAARVIAGILKDDFLTYPHYLREGDMEWEEYCNYVKSVDHCFSGLIGKDLSDAVKAKELANMDDFYIRVYVDMENRAVLIIGYITREVFIETPALKKMVQKYKSEDALYLYKTLKSRNFIKNFVDDII